MRITSAPSSSKRLRGFGRIEDRGDLLVQALEHRRRRAHGREDAPPVAAPRSPARRLRRRSAFPASRRCASRRRRRARLQLARAHVRHVLHQLPRLICTWPAIVSVSAGPPPLYCTMTKSIFDCSRKSSVARCWKLPMPAARGVQLAGLLPSTIHQLLDRVRRRARRHHQQRRPAAQQRTGAKDCIDVLRQAVEARCWSGTRSTSAAACSRRAATSPPALMPIMPPAPPRLSITTLWPQPLARAAAPIARPTTSLLPPGGNGMIRRIGFVG